MTALHDMELLELTGLIQRKEVSPVEATRAQLDRIEALDGGIHAYALVLADEAMAAARQAEAEIGRGGVAGPAAWRADRGEGSVLAGGAPDRGGDDGASGLRADRGLHRGA